MKQIPKKKIPSIKKDLRSFLNEEEGKITKKDALMTGVTIAIMGFLTGRVAAQHDNCWGQEHNSHSNAPCSADYTTYCPSDAPCPTYCPSNIVCTENLSTYDPCPADNPCSSDYQGYNAQDNSLFKYNDFINDFNGDGGCSTNYLSNCPLDTPSCPSNYASVNNFDFSAYDQYDGSCGSDHASNFSWADWFNDTANYDSNYSSDNASDGYPPGCHTHDGTAWLSDKTFENSTAFTDYDSGYLGSDYGSYDVSDCTSYFSSNLSSNRASDNIGDNISNFSANQDYNYSSNCPYDDSFNYSFDHTSDRTSDYYSNYAYNFLTVCSTLFASDYSSDLGANYLSDYSSNLGANYSSNCPSNYTSYNPCPSNYTSNYAEDYYFLWTYCPTYILW